MVAAGFSLRFLPSDGCMRVSRKLRNLKDAATQIAQFRLKLLLNLPTIKKSPRIMDIFTIWFFSLSRNLHIMVQHEF
jgi:hypothetical protein